MTSITSAVNTEKWGKETEKQLGAGDDDAWRKDMYMDTIPWEYGRFREVLEKYSKIPPNEVEAEIFKIVREEHPPYLTNQLLFNLRPSLLTITSHHIARQGLGSRQVPLHRLFYLPASPRIRR